MKTQVMKKMQTTIFQKLQLLKRSIKQLRQVKTNRKKSSLILRIKRLFRQLERWTSFAKLKPSIVASMIAVGFSFGPQVISGQNFFEEPVVDGFGVQTIESDYGRMLSFADLDNDGDFDLLASNFAINYFGGTQEYFYYENKGNAATPNFTGPKINPFGLSASLGEYGLEFPGIFVDLDNDGDFDVLSSATIHDLVSVFIFQENIGTKEAPSFAESVNNPLNLDFGNTQSYFNAISAVDLDEDGDTDIVVNVYSTYYGSKVLYFENTVSGGNVSFKDPIDLGTTVLNLQFFEYIFNSSFADMDNDGDQDFLGTHAYGSDSTTTIRYYENISDNAIKFKAPVDNPFNLQSEDDLILPVLVDIDEDSDFDIFSFEFTEYGYENDTMVLHFYENTRNIPDNVGIEDVIEKSTFKVVPNPATDFVRITLGDDIITENAFVKIYDLKGKILFQQPLNKNTIDVSDLVSGVYVLVVNHENVNHYRKLIIER